MTGTTVPAQSTPNGGRREMLGEGVVAGVLGATALAGWLLVVDGIRGVPLLTVSILVSGVPDLPAPHPKLAPAG